MGKARFFPIAIAMASVLSVGLATLALAEVVAQRRYRAKTHGGTSNDHVHSVKQTSNGVYIVVRERGPFGGGGGNFWALKLDLGSIFLTASWAWIPMQT
jgi:hypothetical protein